MPAQPLDPGSPPAWAVEAVRLGAYDPRWPDRAAGYADELQPMLARWLLGPLEHVVSTAIHGIVAKPVVDLMAQVTDPDAMVGQAGGTLDAMNWRHVPPAHRLPRSSS